MQNGYTRYALNKKNGILAHIVFLGVAVENSQIFVKK